MNVIIKTTHTISPLALEEVKKYLDITFTVRRIDDKPTPNWNPYFRVIEISWDWLTSLFDGEKYDAYCYVTSEEYLHERSITRYLGQYNLLNTKTHYFWLGLPQKKRSATKLNGFTYDFTRLFIHELLHGFYPVNLVHDMEKQGRLKELSAMHTKKQIEAMENQVSFLTKMLETLKLTSRYARPLPHHWKLVSQGWLNPDPKTYPKTGVHTGTDFAAPLATPILAPGNGVVTRSGYSASLGFWCEFHFDSYYLVCLHLSGKVALAPARKGDPIGFVGKTGAINGVHAHLELWKQPMNRALLTSRAQVEKYTEDITKLIP